MKCRYAALFLFASFLAISQWSCKNNVVATDTPTTARVSGSVVGSNSGTPVEGAMVVLSYSNTSDSVVTGKDGTFSFVIDVPDTATGVDVTLTVHGSGYLTFNRTFKVKSDRTFPVSLNINSATYAVLSGVVQDSLSQYPLGGASVLISLPSGSASAMRYKQDIKSRVKSVSAVIIASATTLENGTFVLPINLYSLDSLHAVMTVSKTGFVTYRDSMALVAGTNKSLAVPLHQDNSMSVVHLVGRVTDSDSKRPITNVTVILTCPLLKDSVKTLSDGSYSFDIDLQGLSSTSGTLTFSLTSYNDVTSSFTADAGQKVTKDVAMIAKTTVVGGDSATGRGVARSFYLVNASPTEISVSGVGGVQTSNITWQVLDSLGFPLDIGHSATVTFEISNAAGLGGAYIIPTEGVTDGAGKVSTTVNSGTVAGTIQIIAKLVRSDGRVVQSQPVLITADGGFPDQAHFTFGVNTSSGGTYNFAGYDWFGRTDEVIAQAGDKYGNPVHRNTAVYFTSTWGGIATAAGYTSNVGQATATLLSGNPLPHISGLDPKLYGSPSDTLLPILDAAYNYPNDPTYFGGGTGYGFVKASTYGEDSVLVTDSALVLFSAKTAPILLNYSSNPILGDTIVNGGAIKIPVHISDRFGNPLEPGTEVSVNVKMPPIPTGMSGSWSVDPSGLPSTLADHLRRGPGSTDFVLVLTGSEINIAATAAFNVTITVTGRNGSATNTISGTLVP